ncbi:MAG TPA: hypothetical protein VHG51_11020 [Longimicrobiaceae bacterium]|nr:hypothetical protein [Longimicrobiaceae bacterium]
MGAALLKSAADLLEVADERSTYGNAVAIIAIHATIAYCDALTIGYGGVKSGEGEHLRAVEVLNDVLGTRAEAEALRALTRVLQKKDAVSYQGEYYGLDEARLLLDRARWFAAWAEVLLARPFR